MHGSVTIITSHNLGTILFIFNKINQEFSDTVFVLRTTILTLCQSELTSRPCTLVTERDINKPAVNKAMHAFLLPQSSKNIPNPSNQTN